MLSGAETGLMIKEALFMKRIFVFLLVLVVAGISQAIMVNVVNDANLRTAVINRLNLDANYAPPISPSDMNHPTAIDMNRPSFTFLDANHLGISDLNGLEYATNLKTLYLADNNISDLGLLSGLKKMQYLRLWGNSNLANLAPLADMNALLSFRAYDCNIADINVVSKFIKLQSLHLALNKISDINALSGLTKLTYLNLHDNYISDINSLSALIKLAFLDLSYNNDILDINAISDMNSLVEIGLSDVNLINISPLADVNQIQYLWLGYNRIQDINSLTKYHNLISLSLSYNSLSFQSWCVYLKQIKSNNPTANIYTAPPASSSLIDIDSTDVNDLQIFANKWLSVPCNTNNAYCNCADSTESGTVNFDDFVDFADVWMYQPQKVFMIFKKAAATSGLFYAHKKGRFLQTFLLFIVRCRRNFVKSRQSRGHQGSICLI